MTGSFFDANILENGCRKIVWQISYIPNNFKPKKCQFTRWKFLHNYYLYQLLPHSFFCKWLKLEDLMSQRIFSPKSCHLSIEFTIHRGCPIYEILKEYFYNFQNKIFYSQYVFEVESLSHCHILYTLHFSSFYSINNFIVMLYKEHSNENAKKDLTLINLHYENIFY